MKYYKKLEGERIYLSPMNMNDAGKYAEWLNDFYTTDYIGRSGHLITEEMEREWLQKHNEGEPLFAIIEKEGDKLIGNTGIHNISPIDRHAIFGIFIGDKESRNKGYGEETIKLVLDFGFNYLNLNSIELTVYCFNKRAIACYKKCGFKECGIVRKAKYLNGKYQDIMHMDILAEEFKGNYIKNKNI